MSVNVTITLYIDTPVEMTDTKVLEKTLTSCLTKEIAILNPNTGKINYRNMSIAKFEVE